MPLSLFWDRVSLAAQAGLHFLDSSDPSYLSLSSSWVYRSNTATMPAKKLHCESGRLSAPTHHPGLEPQQEPSSRRYKFVTHLATKDQSSVNVSGRKEKGKVPHGRLHWQQLRTSVTLIAMTFSASCRKYQTALNTYSTVLSAKNQWP